MRQIAHVSASVIGTSAHQRFCWLAVNKLAEIFAQLIRVSLRIGSPCRFFTYNAIHLYKSGNRTDPAREKSNITHRSIEGHHCVVCSIGRLFKLM